MSEIFPLEQLGFDGFPDKYNSSNDFQSREGGHIVYQTQLNGTNDWGMSKDINSFYADLGCEDDKTEEELGLSKAQQEEQVELFSQFKGLDDMLVDIVSPPLKLCQKVTKLARIQYKSLVRTKFQNETKFTFPGASVEILKNYGSRFSQLHGEKRNATSYGTAQAKVSGPKLSTNEILQLGGQKFIQSCSQRVDDLSFLSHPFSLLDEEAKDVELVKFLLISAEKVGQQQFDRASKLLHLCDELSSTKGNPVQRLVYYFSEALQEKIDRETGRISSKGLGNKQSFDIREAMMSPNPTVISYHQKVPFSQVGQFAAMQAIVENLADAKRVHIIEFEIRNGTQCIILMLALAARRQCPLEHFKVTALGTKSQEKIEETGKRLMSFAQSMNVSFSFNVVMVADMLDLNENHFMLDAEETVAVQSVYFMCTLLAWPSRLEHLMRVIRNIDPCIMVISEVEGNHNSPVFEKRFIEALFFYGAFFDAIEDCMDCENANRSIAESIFLSQGIRTIVAAEGEERTTRHVSISVWRAFFGRFGVVEKEVSMSSLYQASLVIKNFACGSSCTVDRDGNGLIIGWKGTPIYSLSTWKFL